MTVMEKTAGCLCGAVRFSVVLTEPHAHACHCSMCRRWSGGVFFVVEAAEPVRFKSDETLRFYGSSDWGERGFCERCGSSLFWRMADGSATAVSAGALDDLAGLSIESEIFIDDKPAMYALHGEHKRMTGAEVMALYAPRSA